MTSHSVPPDPVVPVEPPAPAPAPAPPPTPLPSPEPISCYLSARDLLFRTTIYVNLLLLTVIIYIIHYVHNILYI